MSRSGSAPPAGGCKHGTSHGPGGLSPSRRRLVTGLAAAALAAPWPAAAQGRAGKPPVRIGLVGAMSVAAWSAPRAIEAGIAIAIDEINASGGVLGGRPLELLVRDHRTVNARARDAVAEFAQTPDLVAMFCDSFSPAVLEVIKPVHDAGLVLLNPWASADAIIDHPYQPNWAFRLSLRDSWAMPCIVRHAARRGHRRLGMLTLANAWGRSNEAALKSAVAVAGPDTSAPRLAATEWHDASDNSAVMRARYQRLLDQDAEAVVLVASVDDSCALLTAMADFPIAERLPVLSHWGLAAGDFVAVCGEPLQAIDLRVVQTFNALTSPHARARRILADGAARLGVANSARLPSPAGLAHAYDLTRILSLAIERARSTSRPAIRSALTEVRGYRGLVRDFDRPFTAERHEALTQNDVFMARFDHAGQLRRVD